MGVVGAGLRDAAHAVVAVAQQLDSQAVMLGGQPIEAGKQLVEKTDQLFGGALSRQRREPANVGEQNAEKYTRT